MLCLPCRTTRAPAGEMCSECWDQKCGLCHTCMCQQNTAPILLVALIVFAAIFGLIALW